MFFSVITGFLFIYKIQPSTCRVMVKHKENVTKTQMSITDGQHSSLTNLFKT